MFHRKKIPVPKTVVPPKNDTPGTKTFPSAPQGNDLNEKQLKPPPLFPTSQIKSETEPIVKKTW